jgi:hypothetical protein
MLQKITEIKNNETNKKIVVTNISDTFDDSNILLVCSGHIILSKYIRTINSKTTLSLNKKPVYITNLRTHESAVFFW